MQCKCQFVEEKVCVSSELRHVCMCVFFTECRPRTICACVTCDATSSMDGRTTHTQTHRHRHTHRQTHNHTPNHTDTPYNTPTYTNPPWFNTAGPRAGGRQFFRVSYTEGFFSSGHVVSWAFPQVGCPQCSMPLSLPGTGRLQRSSIYPVMAFEQSTCIYLPFLKRGDDAARFVG